MVFILIAGAGTRFSAPLFASNRSVSAQSASPTARWAGWRHSFRCRTVRHHRHLYRAGTFVARLGGEESLAQVDRELESPSGQSQKSLGWFHCEVTALCCTSLVSFFAVMILPPSPPGIWGNLIVRLAMNLAGPQFLVRLVFHAFLVVGGAVILAVRGEHRIVVS